MKRWDGWGLTAVPKKREPIDKAYCICQTYNRLGKNTCTSHKIEAHDFYNLVLENIITHAKLALQDAETFYQRLSHIRELTRCL